MTAPELDLWESRKRDAVLERHESGHADALRVLRFYLRAIYEYRLRDVGYDAAFVTAMDAREYLRSHPSMDTPANRNWLGALFRERGWQRTGQSMSSETEGSHGTELPCWRWVG